MAEYYLNFHKIKELTQNGDNYLVKLIHRYVHEYSGGKIILEKELDQLNTLDLEVSLANFNRNAGVLQSQIDQSLNELPAAVNEQLYAGGLSYDPEENVYNYDNDNPRAVVGPGGYDDDYGDSSMKKSVAAQGSIKQEIHSKLWALNRWLEKNIPFNKLNEKYYKNMLTLQKYFCQMGEDMRNLILEVNKDVLKAKQQIELEKKKNSLDFIERTLINNGILCSIDVLPKENQIII